MESVVREILHDCAVLAVPVEGLSPLAELAAAGLTAEGRRAVLGGLEQRLRLSVPRGALARKDFRSIASLAAAAEALRGHRLAA
jgi:hypothetical protein